MKRTTPSPVQERILRCIDEQSRIKPNFQGLKSSELETLLGLTTGEVRMALKWLSDNGYAKGTKRIVKFNFGHQGTARKPLMFWTITDQGGDYVNPKPATPAQPPGNGAVPADPEAWE